MLTMDIKSNSSFSTCPLRGKNPFLKGLFLFIQIFANYKRLGVLGANEPVRQFRKAGLTDSFDWSFRIKLYNNGNRESVKE